MHINTYFERQNAQKSHYRRFTEKLTVRIGYFLAFILTVTVLNSQIATAHILVPDTIGKTGAILHVTPGDDPVAGVDTGIYYEVDSATTLKNATVTLSVKSDTGGIEENLPVEIHGQSVSAVFNFPVRGLYFLRLSISENNKKPVLFESSQRVTHSKKGDDPLAESPAWAKVGMVFSVWGLVLLGTTAFKRRKIIKKHSS